MSFFMKKEIARILIFAFLIFLIPADTYSVKGDEKVGLKLIKEGEKLFRQYKYSQSVDKFHEAEKYVKDEKNLSRLYLGLSRTYYALGLMERVKEAVNRLALLSIKSPIKKDQFPRGFLKIYEDILTAVEKKKADQQIVKKEEDLKAISTPVKTVEEEKPLVKEEKKTGIIEKPGFKTKKKKSLILPIVLGAVALGAAAVLLGGGKSDGAGSENTAAVHIESNPSGAEVFVDGASKGVVTPCDITVSEGSREIRLMIEGWGEAINIQSFSKDRSYSLNAKLTGYIYKPDFSYEINPQVLSGKWDLDHDGNLYAIYIQDGNYHLEKYNSEGVEIFNRVLQYNKAVTSNFYVFFNNIINVLYLQNYSSDTIHIYNPEGEDSGSYNNINMAEDLTESSSGGFYINQNGIRIQEYDSNYQFVRNFLNSSSYSTFGGIKFSYDYQHLYIVFGAEKIIRKYDLSGNIIQSWSSDDWYSVSNITSHGSGDLERIFVQVYTDTKRIEVYNGNGELLSRSEGQGQTMVKIAEDGIGNIYAGSSTVNNLIVKWGPSDVTSGDGIWEASSTTFNNSRRGTNGTTRIDSLQRNQNKRPRIKKETEKKKNKKDLY